MRDEWIGRCMTSGRGYALYCASIDHLSMHDATFKSFEFVSSATCSMNWRERGSWPAVSCDVSFSHSRITSAGDASYWTGTLATFCEYLCQGMHSCNGRLCDLCRARIMTVSIARPSARESQLPRKPAFKTDSKAPVNRTTRCADVSSEPRNLHSAEEIENLLQQLADMSISREEREKLHSRLLAGLPDKTRTGDTYYKLAGSPQAKHGAELQPQSRFSDSSDDENEGEASAETSTVYYRSHEQDRLTLVQHKSPPANKDPRTTTTVFDIDL